MSIKNINSKKISDEKIDVTGYIKSNCELE